MKKVLSVQTRPLDQLLLYPSRKHDAEYEMKELMKGEKINKPWQI